jgi:hypothetical protein
MANVRVEFRMPEDELRAAKVMLIKHGYRDLSSVIRWLINEWVKEEGRKEDDDGKW